MKPIQVLFICTGNSARSILAEASLNHHGKGRFQAYSAGSQPTGRINPWAIQQLEKAQISIQGYRSKSWDEFRGVGAPALDIVITVCDSAARETCPVLFGDFVCSHWGLPDPAATQGDDAHISAAFAAALHLIRHRVGQLIGLPETLLRDPAQREELRERLAVIGASQP